MRKIFIDAGANTGQSVEAWYAIKEDASEYMIFSFEASNKVFRSLQKRLAKRGYRNVTAFNDAVYTYDGAVSFVDWGNESSTTESRFGEAHFKEASRMVPCVDLARFIKQFSKNDLIILKMDVEGGEYEIIPHLNVTGALKYVDKLYIELHACKIKNRTIEDDYKVLKIIKDNNLIPYLWAAGRGSNWSKNDTNRFYNRDRIAQDWRKKGRLGNPLPLNQSRLEKERQTGKPFASEPVTR